uniref:Uncharacterized protein n=1 Tax=Rhodnius prolixus TaxID=13249 RepID=T1HU62_RHOPR
MARVIGLHYAFVALFLLLDGLSGTASGRSSDMQVLALQNLTNLLSKTFPSQFVFPVLGHNDPGSSPGERLGYKDVGQFWRQWLPTEAINSFNKDSNLFAANIPSVCLVYNGSMFTLLLCTDNWLD